MATAQVAQQGAAAVEPRNIVICCDGTGNEVGGNYSNVLKLFRIVRKDDRQHVFYDPGVGTIAVDGEWTRLKTNARAIFGLATGAGLDDNILDAYRFLAATYQPGDRIFLFGFSRGAYTVRALAGLINMVGLLWPDQLNLCDYALTAYKKASEQHDLPMAWSFGRAASSRRITIHFVGVWDTVASMIVPRPDRFFLPSLRTLPYTRRNPIVRAFRHAIAIDERRRMFRLNRWEEGQGFVADPFVHPPQSEPQDCRQVWFAGVHSDVGGGYPESESGLSKFPLIWMVEEAVEHGLRISGAMLDHLARGESRQGDIHVYVPPDPCAKLHNSLTWLWWILEVLPKSARWREWRRWSLSGFYWPFGEPRLIEAGAHVHHSVGRRRDECPDADYRPVNLPPGQRTWPVEGPFSRFARLLVQLFAGAALALGLLWVLQWLVRHVFRCLFG